MKCRGGSKSASRRQAITYSAKTGRQIELSAKKHTADKQKSVAAGRQAASRALAASLMCLGPWRASAACRG
ncbi:hypothetical protein BHM03_00004117 [Ensete ventricosum]|nr:hypothetical protein BHM03_00004117 [Ensete ventricosum]